ncbi:glycosyltransferase (plasmid) [Shinella sp. H4-D48]|uniref:glycosyltransferase n=1 Tax=Shinella sp. H4-D48 TaxID=2925841 RepID=UPI001F52E476|nr:glycosyltransferase [Shinella sp. H4-D48]UNK40469.1 glycosyltransferase [Shinella sp. H4-D48]
MKIVHVITSIDPDSGGPQAVVMRLAAAQASLGHDVRVVSQADDRTLASVARLGATIPGFRQVVWNILPPPGTIEAILCLKARPFLTRILTDSEQVHLHGVWEPILACAAAIATRNGIPYCVCPAGMLDTWSLAQKPWKKRFALAVAFRRMLDNAAFLHALNRDEVKLMRPLQLKAPAEIIPNGVFTEEFETLPSAADFPTVLGLPTGRRFVLFLSRLHYKKGLDLLASAFQLVARQCPDVDLVVAGPDGGAENDFRDLVRRFDLESRVFMVGPIYGETKLQAFAAAACFCLPSRQEGFSIAITEALACGTPVVITDACHFPEVSAAGAGAVVSLDPMEIATALIDVLSHPLAATAMGYKGRRLVFENYTWPRIAHRTISLYEAYRPVAVKQSLTAARR